jgi:hypothetical protein
LHLAQIPLYILVASFPRSSVFFEQEGQRIVVVLFIKIGILVFLSDVVDIVRSDGAGLRPAAIAILNGAGSGGLDVSLPKAGNPSEAPNYCLSIPARLPWHRSFFCRSGTPHEKHLPGSTREDSFVSCKKGRLRFLCFP